MTLESTPILIAELEGHDDKVWCASWHPSGNLLASCSGDKSIRIWSFSADSTPVSKCVAVLDHAHKRTIRCVAWSPDGRYLASASFDGTTAIWERMSAPKAYYSNSDHSDVDDLLELAHMKEDEDEWECVATLEGHENEVKSVCWFADSSLLATCSRDKSVWIWEMTGQGDFECLAVLTEHTQDCKQVAFHPNKVILASASYDNTVKLWEDDENGIEDFRCVQTLKDHENTVWSVDWSIDGTGIATAGADMCINLYSQDASSAGTQYRHFRTIKGAHSRPIYSISWSHSNNLILSGAGDNSVKVWATDGSCVAEVKSPHGLLDVNCVSWNPSLSNYFLSSGDDCKVKIWKL